MRDSTANKSIAQVTARQLPIAPPKPDIGEVVKQAILHIGESADENAALMRDTVTKLMEDRPQPKKRIFTVERETDKSSVNYGLLKRIVETTVD